MTFQDYFHLMKSGLRERISDEELCNLLLDCVVKTVPIYKMNSQELYYLDKSATSKLINGRMEISDRIINHISDEVVTKSIVQYFAEKIVPRLQPATGELRQQMLCALQKDAACTPAMGTIFAALSKADAPALFFATAFLYVLTAPYQTRPTSTASSFPAAYDLTLSCITSEQHLDHAIHSIPFAEAIPFPSASVYKEILEAYKDISSIDRASLDEHRKTWGAALPAVKAVMLPLMTNTRVSIQESVQTCIREFAEEHDISLADDFFDVGDLREYKSSISTSFQILGQQEDPVPFGTGLEQGKYQKIQSLPKKIAEYQKRLALEKLFDDTFVLRLGLTNDSSLADESIHVSLYLPKDACYQREDLEENDRAQVESVRSDYRFSDLFFIPKAEEYLAYGETRTSPPQSLKHIPFVPPLMVSEQEYFDEVWDDIFPYSIFQHGDEFCIQLHFDQLNPKTSAAFPRMILLKHPVDSIRYQIQSKHAPEAITGELHLPAEETE